MKRLRSVFGVRLAAALMGGALAACAQKKDSPLPLPTAAGLAQVESDGANAIPPGGVTGEGRVIFQAVVGAPAETAPVRLNVEVVPVGNPFTGTSSAVSDFVESGAVAKAALTGLAPGDYAWRAWAEDSQGRTSGPEEFNGPLGTDFKVDPSVPTHLGQFRLDGALPIAVGGDTPEVGVMIRAQVHQAEGNMVRAQFEVKPISADFDGNGVVVGAWVEAGQLSTGTEVVPVGGFHWRARTEAYGGSTGEWVAFGANSDVPPAETDFKRVPVTVTSVPDLPSRLGQYHTDGTAWIPVGGSTGETAVVLSGIVSDTEGGLCAMELEVKPVAQVFDGSGTVVSPFVGSRSTAAVAVTVAQERYHWRARTVSTWGAVSDWVSFGGNSDGVLADVDFAAVYAADRPPDAPSALQQYQLDGVTVIPYGGSTSETGLVLQGTVRDPDVGNGLVLEVEVRPAGTAFLNVPTAAGPVVASGTQTSVKVTGLKPGTTYRWQARAEDAAGTASPWVEFTGAPAPAPPVSTSSSGGGSGGGSFSCGGGCGGSLALSLHPGRVLWVTLLATFLGLGFRRKTRRERR